MINDKKSFISTTVADTEEQIQTQQQYAYPLYPQFGDAQATPSEVTREQLSLGKRLLHWRTLVPLAIVIIALVFLAQKAHLNPQEIWAAIQHANPLFLLAAFASYYISFGFRALRWKILLENVGFKKENGVHLPPLLKLIEIIYISFFANSVVPAKLGDLYRAYMLRQEIGVSTTRSFGTVLAERLLDLIVLLLLIIPSMLFSLHQQLPAQILLGMKLLLGLVLIGIAGLFVLRVAHAPIARIIPPRFREQYYHFQEGTLGSFRRLPQLTGLTIAVWGCEAMSFFFISLALNFIRGTMLYIFTSTIVIGLSEALLSVLPTTGGGIGVVEGGMDAVAHLFYNGANFVNNAAAAILLDRMITYVSVLLIGSVVFLIAFGRNTGRARK